MVRRGLQELTLERGHCRQGFADKSGLVGPRGGARSCLGARMPSRSLREMWLPRDGTGVGSG